MPSIVLIVIAVSIAPKYCYTHPESMHGPKAHCYSFSAVRTFPFSSPPLPCIHKLKTHPNRCHKGPSCRNLLVLLQSYFYRSFSSTLQVQVVKSKCTTNVHLSQFSIFSSLDPLCCCCCCSSCWQWLVSDIFNKHTRRLANSLSAPCLSPDGHTEDSIKISCWWSHGFNLFLSVDRSVVCGSVIHQEKEETTRWVFLLFSSPQE